MAIDLELSDRGYRLGILVSDEEQSKRPRDPQALQREIDRRAEEHQKQYKRVHIRKLIPSELVYAFVVLLLLGLCIALWTVRTVSKDAAERYYNEPLWNLRQAQPQAQSDFVQVEKVYREAVAKAASKGKDEHIKAATSLGQFYLRNGRWDLCAEQMGNAHQEMGTNYGDRNLLEFVDYSLGRADLQMGKSEEAIQWLQKANSLIDQGAVRNTLERKTKILQDLVVAYSDTNNLQAARKACTDLLQRLQDNAAVARADLTIWRCRLADICRRTEDDKTAETIFRQALQQMKEHAGAGPDLARARFGLALTLAREGNSQEANKYFTLAMSVAEQSEGPNSSLVRAIKHAYAYSLWKTNWIAAAAMTFSASEPEAKPR